ncbi:hypothetical protein COLO4_37171 [Corchorus olitorius]|uniref:Protein transport protein sec16 n=1 Tax=Corchorus olitorius TaxID=93759 RepID=A0A1R3G332_9ROSI|nr:hypothetical protein COLO4_37171 [Corchorus olitorius]
MASNPPFQVEDQTDEDFFDKLVNDDDDDNVGPTDPKSTEANDSDDARAFANLTIGEDFGGEAESDKEKEKDPVDGGPAPANVQAVDDGENSTGDFPGKLDENAKVGVLDQNSVNSYGQHNDGGQVYGASAAGNGNEHDLNSSQYWENMYPGWKYDANTGQWYQVDGYEGNFQGTYQSSGGDGSGTTDVKAADVSYLQQTVQSVAGTMATTESSATESVTNWNQASQVNNGYPEHMVFDPQYPGWYYDTVAQEWKTLESYNASVESSIQSNVLSHDQQYQNGSAPSVGHSRSNSSTVYEEYGLGDNYGSQGLGSSGEHGNWGDSYGNYKSQVNMWQPGTVAKTEAVPSFTGNQQLNTSFGLNMPVNNHVNQSKSSYNSLQGGRSSAGRPPHALVTFGFGGKLIVMKDSSPLQNSSFGSQDSVGASISVLNMLEVVSGNTNGSGAAVAGCDYFRTLCQQSFPGPLVGGNVGSKELNKWVDDRIANCESPEMDYRKGSVLRLLLSLLKIACQHYGKLRSPFGADTVLKETDTPESAVAKLFASSKRNDTPYGALTHCLQQLPSEGQLRATASEVQNLLVSGRKKEALQCAQEGQLWGPALVLASQLGNQFYVDTVKQMAIHQLVAGSPLRTLCLLIAGQPAEVFSTGTEVNSMDMSQQNAQLGANFMLDDWEENLAVITANRTKDDELVIIHLGDCLWKEKSEITAAHICYLIAEANFESYSDTARLCLIGSDHWKFPRTYASPEAIQRTELYEYSKVLGNSQFILLPFQPYKLIYAHMLAEVGKVSDSLKYCQAVLKSLKTGRSPEVETWKQLVSSLEERIRIHQQGGYAANLAPAKLVGKLLNFFDSTAHRVVGGLPPAVPSASNGYSQGNENYHQQTGPRVSSSQSTMAMSSLMSSASMEPISDWTGRRTADGKMTMHNRSVSEPDFGRTPRQVDSSKEAGGATPQGKESSSGGASRFARFGFGSQLLQKTVGLVLRPRADKQAKLGEKNKFYYDEKLKRWVEEGAEPPAEEAALPPPPTTAAFQNGMSDYNLKSGMKSEGSPTNGSPKFRNPTPIEHASGIPPIPTSSNQFSARGRMGVRARYVDTFNQGGGSQANLFQSPAVPSVKPAVAANAKFFIPTPAVTSEHTMEAIAETAQEENATNNNPTISNSNESFQSPIPISSMTMQRFPSMDNIARNGIVTNANGSSAHSRRTASWSAGNFSDALSPPSKPEIRPLGEALGIPPSAYMPSPTNGSFGDELHEVEL